jgi:hypothetical protein
MGSRQGLVPAYVLSAVAVVAAVLGSLVVMETATVKLTVPTSKLTANLTISGGQSGHDLTTTRIESTVTDSQQGTASTVVVSTYASGQVVFTCSPCPSGTLTIPDGTMVSTTSGIHYATVGRADISAPQTSIQVPIRAVAQGPHGNTAKDTVTVIDKPITNVKVTNPQPITGGADAAPTQVVQQSDLDRVRTALTAQVLQDLGSALKAQAGGLGYATEGEPALKITSDHKVGDQVATFTMTITGTTSAIAYSEGKADALLRAALEKKLPKGFKLTSDPIQTSYQIQGSSQSGDVTIKGAAIGVAEPSVTANELKARIKGTRVEAARKQLMQVAPGSSVDISVKPAIPWLPVLQDHIALTIVALPPTSSVNPL